MNNPSRAVNSHISEPSGVDGNIHTNCGFDFNAVLSGVSLCETCAFGRGRVGWGAHQKAGDCLLSDLISNPHRNQEIDDSV